MMIKEYVTVHSNFQIDFDREVNARLSMGWELYGYQSNHYTPTGLIYVQVMIKYEEEQCYTN